MDQRALGQVKEAVQDLEAFPRVVLRLLQALDSPDASVAEIAHVLELDQALAGRVVGMANSAYWGRSRRIIRVSEALVRVGYRTVRDLALEVATGQWLRRGYAGYGLGQGELWRHTLACAVSARALASACGSVAPDEGYMAGLLHDVGKAIIDRALPGPMAEMRQRMEEEQVSAYEAELAVMGFDHGYVGALTCERLGLPENLANPVRWHHDAGRAGPEARLAGLVSIADGLASSLGYRGCGSGPVPGPDAHIMAVLGLSPGDLEAVAPVVQQAMGDAEELVDPGSPAPAGEPGSRRGAIPTGGVR